MNTSKRYAPEVRQRAVRMMKPIIPPSGLSSVLLPPKIGCTPETLRNWVRQAERDVGRREGTTTSERERIKALERENRELKQANEILRKASAYFVSAPQNLQLPISFLPSDFILLPLMSLHDSLTDTFIKTGCKYGAGLGGNGNLWV